MSARALVIGSLFALIGGPWAGARAEAAPLPADSVYQLPASVTDSTGRDLLWRDLRGKPRVATLFYTSCKFVCPLIVDSLRGVERALGEAERRRVGFVLISMDPSRDTPATLARVMEERRLNPETWLLLQPRQDDLRALAGVLGVRYRALADGEFNHTTTLVLLDAEGRVLARTDRVGGDGDPEFLEAVRTAAAAPPVTRDRGRP
jgi:protein SCO1/2